MSAPSARRPDLQVEPGALRRRCDPASLPFQTTAELTPHDGTGGQQRALRALDLAVGIDHVGYNVFATGPRGLSKREAVQARLEEHAAGRPAAPDVVFLFNFEDPDTPLCASLPAGDGRRLEVSMRAFVAHATREIPMAFESDSYQRRRGELLERLEREREQLIEPVRSFARSRGLDLEITPAGAVTIPIVHGRPVTPQEFTHLPEEERRRAGDSSREVKQRMDAIVPDLRRLDSKAREEMKRLQREVVLYAVGHLIDDVAREHADSAAVGAWLERAREDLVENYEGFMAGAEQAELPPPVRAMVGRGVEAFRARYEANAFVSREPGRGAPVIVERNPTYPRLFGRIEFETSLGAVMTDHRRIRPGAIHRARGGYLILRAEDVLGQPFAWQKLKDVLRSRQARVENPGEQYTLFPTATLTPEPVPVDVKVVLVATGELYTLLHALDDEVAELFRIRADFDVQMRREDEEVAAYAAFAAAQVADNDLPPLDAAAVALLVELASRRAAHQDRLSTRFSEARDLVVEAAHEAVSDGAQVVGAAHVERAAAARRERSSLLEERIGEAIGEGVIEIDVRGSRVGQLNGLAVVQQGDHAFGHPARITATTATGGGELVSIDRESDLTGKIHDKGFLTLRGYLEQSYGGRAPLALSASITFEQSYGGLEGDSASSTELYALLSSLADAPIEQGVAVTGSVDQYGRVQAVGGVTEKVEGFFAACEREGLTGEQGVVIPAANVRHLMLDERVVAAVREGRFAVWAVSSIDEGLEILTGVPAGARGADGTYPEDSIHGRVQARLLEMASLARKWIRGAEAD